MKLKVVKDWHPIRISRKKNILLSFFLLWFLRAYNLIDFEGKERTTQKGRVKNANSMIDGTQRNIERQLVEEKLR